jgi:hypothetical protein
MIYFIQQLKVNSKVGKFSENRIVHVLNLGVAWRHSAPLAML